MMRAIIAAAAAALGGCATMRSDAPPAPPTAGLVETISYETSPCFGFCPVYTVTVSSDGRGIFEGRQHTGVTGTREFIVSREQYAEFSSRLAPYRPSGERRIADPNCNGMIATDLPSVEIVWSGKGPQSRLYAYYGCDMERNEAMFEALRQAPQALPIEAFIGSR